MLGGGARGVIVEPDASKVADVIEQFVSAPDTYTKACQAAMDWSRQYDLEHFEEEIVKLIEV
jgi:glycosyltransferase involved in cell wall biosynthesis